MIRRIRALMATPFARPPGRRSVWARFAPEWCAGVVYLTFGASIQVTLDMGYRLPFMDAMVVAYLAAGLLLLVVPVGQMAAAWAGERDLGTMDSLLLTPAAPGKLVRGRFWSLALPWLRFFVWLLPLYGMQAQVGMSADPSAHLHDFAFLSSVYALGSKPLLAAMLWDMAGRSAIHSVAWGAMLTLVRILKDLLDLALVLSVAYYISIRVARSSRAVFLAYTMIPCVVVTAAGLADLLLLGAMFSRRALRELIGWAPVKAQIFGAYAVISVLVVAAEAVIVWLLLRRVVRNFDAWALGEKPGP
jgi:hypothetical protein